MPRRPESSIEIRQIGETGVGGDDADGLVRFYQPHAGPSNPQAAQIVSYAFAGVTHEQAVERSFRYVPDGAQIIQRNRLREALVQQIQDSVQLGFMIV